MSFVTHSLVDLLTKLPEPFIWRFARRYIAGSTLDHGLRVAADLKRNGFLTTLDVLGEDIEHEHEADQALQNYLDLIAALPVRGLVRNISLKLSQFGQKLNPGTMESRIMTLMKSAAEHDLFVRIDMEDASTTTATVKLYSTLRQQYARTGTVIQACLKRSFDDIVALQNEGQTNLRICKGIYIEDPAIAYRDRQMIRDNYMRLIRQMFDGGSYVGIATHDEWLIQESLKEIKSRKISSERYEFQMLLGVGESMRRELISNGHPLRVYIPYGVTWKAYSFRRFRENPKLAWYVVKNLLTKA